MKQIMLGNEAIARGVYEAGATVTSAYPGTPSTEISEYIAQYEDIYAEWAPNEKVAMEVAIGASIGGARAVTAMKHVGLNVAADPLFTVSYTGVNGGLVIIVADDPGMHSSQNEQDSRLYARASKVPMLEPADSQECKDFVIKAFELSEKYDTPVIVRLTTRVAHSRSVVELGERNTYMLKEYVKDYNKYVMMPAMARKRHLFVEDRMARLRNDASDTPFNRKEVGNDIGVITSGAVYQYVKEAMPDASVLKIGIVHPLPTKLIEEFARSVKTLYIVEELEPFIEDQVKNMGLKTQGKNLLPVVGELSAQIIREKIMKEDPKETTTINLEKPIRPPVMCPGCPHRGIFYTLKKNKIHVSGDIGCYTLGALPPLQSMDTCVCMGASVGMAHGMEKARGKEFAQKSVAMIGESTFIHSGITGLINVVYNKGNATVLILDNSTTGMTGHQDNPTTGRTLKGESTRQVDLVKLAEAVGVERVRVFDPFDLQESERILKEELAANEPSVLISQRPCALLKSVKHPGPLMIDQDICTYCKMCLRIACPAIEDKGNGVEINNALCVGCDLCTKLCKFNAIVCSEGK